MRKTQAALTLALAAALTGLVAAAPAAKTITVVGQDDSSVDRAAIQAALDAVAKNGTVELVGVFQLDGLELHVRNSHTTVRGRALDDDGDGKINEDWTDGIDNDLDGAVDEDDWNAVLKGILAGDGTPEEGAAAPFFNRGFEALGLQQVHITDIKFTGLVRGVAYGGTVEIADTFLCSSTFPIPEMRNSSADRNLFDNQNRAVQIFGGSHQVAFRDNVVINHRAGIPIVLVGDEVGCRNADGSQGSFATGRPHNTIIEGNQISDVNERFAAIGVFVAEWTFIRNNEIRDSRSGIGVQGMSNSLIQGNQIADVANDGVQVFEGLDGITGLLSDSSGLKIQNNTVSNAGRWSYALFDDVHDVKLSNNGSLNPGFGDDYFLLNSTHDNHVILKPGQIANDQGTNNKINGG